MNRRLTSPRTGCVQDIVEVDPGSAGAGTLPRAFELGDHIGPGFAVVDEETGISCSRAAATLALWQDHTEDVLKPDPFSHRGVLHQSDRSRHRRDEAPTGVFFRQTAHRVDQLRLCCGRACFRAVGVRYRWRRLVSTMSSLSGSILLVAVDGIRAVSQVVSEIDPAFAKTCVRQPDQAWGRS